MNRLNKTKEEKQVDFRAERENRDRLYAGEGESRKPDENATPPVLGEIGDRDKVSTIIMKGHEFVAISFHMPASCESCTKPLWAPFRPPPAVECRS